MTALENQIYAAAFVAEFNRLHDEGVHAQFRVDHPNDVSARVREWEAWCADLGVEAAETAVKMHRQARSRAEGER